MGTRARRRVEFGDWQTPARLAQRVVATLDTLSGSPAAVVEPTCGRGAFLLAASAQWPQARLSGFELNAEHVASARASLEDRACVVNADFFKLDWEAVFSSLPRPLMVLGNPPWVTNAELGSLASDNLPEKVNFQGLPGMEALTGRGNFDVSEWMVLRLLEALLATQAAQGDAQGGPASEGSFVLAFLVKISVGRRVMEHIARARWPVQGELRGVDARTLFKVAVDAVLLVLRPQRASALALESGGAPEGEVSARWPWFATLDAQRSSRHLGVVAGVTLSDVDAFERTRHLQGVCRPQWRSGLKHDCASVMELRLDEEGRWRNKPGVAVELESECLYPLLKGSDVANGRWPPRRAVVVTQRTIGEDTRSLARRAPRTWAYLEANRAALDGRKSSIYRNQPPFSIFGVGAYSFAPWKVVIAGLYKHLTFQVIGPHQGKPVMVDDTTYFLPFEVESQARAACRALRSEEASDFLRARVFWDDKRPINKRRLQSLELSALMALVG